MKDLEDCNTFVFKNSRGIFTPPLLTKNLKNEISEKIMLRIMILIYYLFGKFEYFYIS